MLGCSSEVAVDAAVDALEYGDDHFTRSLRTNPMAHPPMGLPIPPNQGVTISAEVDRLMIEREKREAQVAEAKESPLIDPVYLRYIDDDGKQMQLPAIVHVVMNDLSICKCILLAHNGGGVHGMRFLEGVGMNSIAEVHGNEFKAKEFVRREAADRIRKLTQIICG